MESIANPDFTVTETAGLATATVNAGQAVTIPLSFTTQGNFTGTVSFSVSGLPVNTFATFVPATLMLTGNTASDSIMIQTSGRFGYLAQSKPPATGKLFAGLMLFPFAGLILAGAVPTRRGRNKRRALLLVLVALCGLSAGGCAVTSSPNVEKIGTPAGTYTLTIVATSGTTVHSVPFTLVVE